MLNIASALRAIKDFFHHQSPIKGDPFIHMMVGEERWNYFLSRLFANLLAMREIHATIRCRGHPNVTGRHSTTLEITREGHLSCQGDCIIGIDADAGASGLPPAFVKVLAHDDAVLHTRLRCREHCITIISRGSTAMTLDHPTDLVWRKSSFVCGRTVGIHSDKAARDLPRELIDYLQDGEDLIVEMTVHLTRPGN
jgi:hypothetical protein